MSRKGTDRVRRVGILWARKNLKPKRCRVCFSNENITLDHIRPISKRGGNGSSNLQWLCDDCHRVKTQLVDPFVTRHTTNERVRSLNIAFIKKQRLFVKLPGRIQAKGEKYSQRNMYPKVCIVCNTAENVSLDFIRPIDCRGGGKPYNLQWLCDECYAAKKLIVKPTIKQNMHLTTSEIQELNQKFIKDRQEFLARV